MTRENSSTTSAFLRLHSTRPFNNRPTSIMRRTMAIISSTAGRRIAARANPVASTSAFSIQAV